MANRYPSEVNQTRRKSIPATLVVVKNIDRRNYQRKKSKANRPRTQNHSPHHTRLQDESAGRCKREGEDNYDEKRECEGEGKYNGKSGCEDRGDLLSISFFDSFYGRYFLLQPKLRESISF